MHNRLRLAEECLNVNREAEARGLVRECLAGMYAADPAIRLNLARAH